MNNLILNNTDEREIVTMTSLEVVELINNFRKEEGSEVKKRHSDFLTSIEKLEENPKNNKVK